jgi:hypothetical protein
VQLRPPPHPLCGQPDIQTGDGWGGWDVKGKGVHILQHACDDSMQMCVWGGGEDESMCLQSAASTTTSSI